MREFKFGLFFPAAHNYGRRMVEEGEVVLDLDGDIPLPTFDSPPSWLADPHDEGTDDDGAVNVDAFFCCC